LGLTAFVVEEKFLLAGYGDSVAGGRLEGPPLDGGQDGFVDAVAQAPLHSELSDVAFRVDDDIYDDITTRAGGQLREIGRWDWVYEERGNLDITLAERVVAGAVVRGERGCGRGDCCWWWNAGDM